MGLASVIFVVSGCTSTSDGHVTSAGLSDYEVAAFADGTISRAEVDEARFAIVGCVEQEGFVAFFEPLDDRVSILTVESGAPRAGESNTEFEERFDDTIEACRTTYLDDIESAWLDQTAPSEEERLKSLAELRSCVAEYGVLVLDASEDGFRELFARIDAAVEQGLDEERNALVACLNIYNLATSEGG